jgi:hypothetical protein
MSARILSLLGFARVKMPSGLIFHDCTINCTAGRYWASPASKAAITREGTQLKKDGKSVYTPVVSFETKELRDKFSDAVIEAMQRAHPEVFAS